MATKISRNTVRQSALSQLRKVVWQMQDTDGCQNALVAIRQGLKTLKVPFEDCGIYLVDCSGNSPTVRFGSMIPDGKWQNTRAQEERDRVVQIWKAGVPVYRRNLDQEDRGRVGARSEERFGSPVRSELAIPFSHGTLTLTSREAAAFSNEDIESAVEIVEVLSILFHRLEDLEELEAREQQILQAQGLALVGQLAAGAAHEINNHLTAVLGHGELLLLNDALEPTVYEGIEVVCKAARQVQGVAAILLNLAGRQKSEKNLLDLNLLVRELVRLIHRQLARENLQLVEELEENLPQIEGHAGQLQQVVLNLVQNGRDAILESKSQGVIKIRTLMREGRLVLEVEDDGPGIPGAFIEKIFEPFFTTKKPGKGTGLGLSVCQVIVKDHKGQLRVEPRTGGACMVVEFP